jgi:hypothetical protein
MINWLGEENLNIDLAIIKNLMLQIHEFTHLRLPSLIFQCMYAFVKVRYVKGEHQKAFSFLCELYIILASFWGEVWGFRLVVH